MIQDWKAVEKNNLDHVTPKPKQLMTPGSMFDGAEMVVTASFADTIVFKCRVCGKHVRKPATDHLTGAAHGCGWEYVNNMPCEDVKCAGILVEIKYADGGACAGMV